MKFRNKLKKKLSELKQKNHDIYFYKFFGTTNKDSDIDIIIIAREYPTLKQCLNGLLDIVLGITNLEEDITIFPTLELKSLLAKKHSNKEIHLILYPSVDIFLRLESKLFVKNISETFLDKKYKNNLKKKNSQYLENYFDLIQKILNSFILLMNKNNNKRIIYAHAYSILTYSTKWLPLKKNVNISKSLFNEKRDVIDLIHFYKEIINQIQL